MHKRFKTIIGASILTMGLLAAPIALYARDNEGTTSGSGHMMGNGSMMGQGSDNMMNMMGQMSKMMESCNNMMQSRDQPPNSEVQKPSPQPKHD